MVIQDQAWRIIFFSIILIQQYHLWEGISEWKQEQAYYVDKVVVVIQVNDAEKYLDLSFSQLVFFLFSEMNGKALLCIRGSSPSARRMQPELNSGFFPPCF